MKLLKLASKENNAEFDFWLENLKDAVSLEEKFLGKIERQYENVLQIALALNHIDLQTYSETPLSQTEIRNIKSRINSYIGPIFDELLFKMAYEFYQETDFVDDIKKEQIDITIVQLLAKIFSVESFKKANDAKQGQPNSVREEISADQYETAFINYNFTRTLIEARFNAEKLPEIGSDYIYISSLELGVDYDYVMQKLNEFMFESATRFTDYLEGIEGDSDKSVGYRTFLQSCAEAALPFLTKNQLEELGYDTKQNTK